MTKIPSTGDESSSEKLTGGSGDGRGPAKYGKHAWEYQVLGVVDSGAPFIRSIAPVTKEKKKQDRLDEQLANAVEDSSLDIDILLCDKGYYRTAVVKVCRDHLGDAWVICAKCKGEVGKVVANAAEGKVVPK